MRRGRPGSPFKSAIAALKADIAGWRKQIVATEVLVAELSARAGIEDSAGGTRGTAPAAREKSAPKRRRRRRHSAPRHVPRNSAQRQRQKSIIKPVQVTAPEPVAAKVELARAARGQDKFTDLLGELEKLKVTLDADADADAIRTLSARGNAILVELGGRAKLPSWCTKALRMRWKRHAAAAGKPSVRAAAVVPKKQKKSRRPPPIEPPVRHDSGWHSENGVLSREIETR